MAGKAALKVGLLKATWLAILARKKYVLLALVAAGVIVAGLFGARRKRSAA